MSKDYYKILGVAEFDTAENIKNAYRMLARKLHPDVAGDSKEALRKFKEINEAYEILSNKIKKDEYDKARRFYNYAKEERHYSERPDKQGLNKNKKEQYKFSWESFFNQKNSTINKEKVKVPKNGKDIFTDINISIFDVISGTNKILNMLQTQICPKCNGKKFVNGTKCAHCKGKGEVTSYKKFNVKIPAGIKNNSKIRLAGEGEKGLNGGKNGDLYITVHLQEAQGCKTEGLNVIKTIPLTPAEAVLGTVIKVNTINGVLSVKIAPKTQNGQKIKVANCGLVQNEKIGDMIIIVEIKIPENLSEAEIELYKKLGEISNGSLRKDF